MTQNIFLDSTTTAKYDQAVGAPKVVEGSDYQLGNALDAAISPTCRSTT